jgi:sensor domain CHASE-containing protein
VRLALWEEIAQLDNQCRTLASWDDTWHFAQDRNEDYIESNLGQHALDHRQADLMIIADTQGAVLWKQILSTTTREPITLREFPDTRIAQAHPLITSLREKRQGGGIYLTDAGPMLVSSNPILDSRGQGPEQGIVILGRFVSAELQQKLHERTKVNFDFWPLDGTKSLPSAEQEIVDEVTSSMKPVVKELDSDFLHVYVYAQDILQKPALLIRANISRRISSTGARSLRYALNSTVAAALLMLLVLLSLIQKTVLSPLSVLTKHAVSISQTEDLFAKLELARNDEVGILAREFNNMMDKLAQSRADLVQAARSAGRSEIATGILHNVGNVLNSVNVSASLLSRKVTKMGVSDLAALAEVVEEQGEDLAEFVRDDPRGRHLRPFLSSIVDHLRSEQSEVVTEVTSLTEGIEHIRQLISSQQSYAIRSELVEWTSASEQLDEALKICNRALSVDPELNVVKEYSGDNARIRVDKHKLLEILVNLIQNARQSMQEARTDPRSLTLRTCQVDGNIRIEVSDNGMGIKREHLVQMFTLGFTTKSTGHGFGLHASANAATEMGGSLTASSDGPGEGATFSLTLPIQVQSQVGTA